MMATVEYNDIPKRVGCCYELGKNCVLDTSDLCFQHKCTLYELVCTAQQGGGGES